MLAHSRCSGSRSCDHPQEGSLPGIRAVSGCVLSRLCSLLVLRIGETPGASWPWPLPPGTELSQVLLSAPWEIPKSCLWAEGPDVLASLAQQHTWPWQPRGSRLGAF